MNSLFIYFFSFCSLFFQAPLSKDIEGTWHLVEYVGFENRYNYPVNLKVENPSSIIISFTPKDSLYLVCGMKNKLGFSGYCKIESNRILKMSIVSVQTITVDPEKVIFTENIGSADHYSIKGDFLYFYFGSTPKKLIFKRDKSENRNGYFDYCESLEIEKLLNRPK